MADDNSKKKQYTEAENKKRLQHIGSVFSPSFFEKRGIKEVGPPIRKGASADSTLYFAKQYDKYDKMENDYLNDRFHKTNTVKIPKEVENRKDFFGHEPASGTYKNELGKIRAAKDEAKDNYFRQGDKGDKGVIFNYDKNGYFVGPFGEKKEAKKEMKPAAIVAPVKRPSEAVMKKVTGKK
jgi:hypothetical protein